MQWDVNEIKKTSLLHSVCLSFFLRSLSFYATIFGRDLSVSLATQYLLLPLPATVWLPDMNLFTFP